MSSDLAVFIFGVTMVKTGEVERDVKMDVGDTTEIAGNVFAFRGVREFAKKRIADINVPPAKDPARRPSWAHARVEWPDGTVREAWLKAGEGMAFTAKVAAEVALRLSRDEGRPGAFTPGALFGTELAEMVGAAFIIE